MKFMLFVLPTVPGTLEDRKRLRPIGRNNERYQQMLDELRKLAVFADDAGFDVMATTEHHFHSEGYETSGAPLPSAQTPRRGDAVLGRARWLSRSRKGRPVPTHWLSWMV